MKNSKKNVQLIAQEGTNLLVVPSKKNPTYGSIQLRAETINMDGGFLRRERRVCFLNGEIEHLEAWLASENLKAGSFISGKIIKKTSFEPFYEGQSPRINPESGENAPDKETGRDVYLEFQYTPDENAVDYWIVMEDEAENAVENTQPLNAEQSF